MLPVQQRDCPFPLGGGDLGLPTHVEEQDGALRGVGIPRGQGVDGIRQAAVSAPSMGY